MAFKKKFIFILLGILVVAISIAFYTGYSEFKQKSQASSHRVTGSIPPAASTVTNLNVQSKPLSASNNKHNKVVLPDSASQKGTLQFDGYQLNAQAIKSLKETRIHGDKRAPKIGKHRQETLPTQKEIDNPDLYQAYETRQKLRVYRSFVLAAKKKMTYLQKEIALAKQKGMPKAQLDEGIQKLEKIKTMRDKLMKQYPKLLSGSSVSQGLNSSSTTP